VKEQEIAQKNKVKKKCKRIIHNKIKFKWTKKNYFVLVVIHLSFIFSFFSWNNYFHYYFSVYFFIFIIFVMIFSHHYHVDFVLYNSIASSSWKCDGIFPLIGLVKMEIRKKELLIFNQHVPISIPITFILDHHNIFVLYNSITFSSWKCDKVNMMTKLT